VVISVSYVLELARWFRCFAGFLAFSTAAASLDLHPNQHLTLNLTKLLPLLPRAGALTPAIFSGQSGETFVIITGWDRLCQSAQLSIHHCELLPGC